MTKTSKTIRVGMEFADFEIQFRRDLERALRRPLTTTEATDAMARLYRRYKPVRITKKYISTYRPIKK